MGDRLRLPGRLAARPDGSGRAGRVRGANGEPPVSGRVRWQTSGRVLPRTGLSPRHPW
ncbi:hypothetical protein [Kitasatospora sp. NBC_00070]|uniref:hypothetical protein n=1 Tax=Kitasatospora sp. NBC_00070 TaxID=2975962 RepID=UPI0038601221